MFIGVAAFVVVNSAVSIVVARRAGSREGLAAALGARVLVNVSLVLLARLVLGSSALDLSATVFVLLISLLVTYHDPVGPGRGASEHDVVRPPPAVVGGT